MLSWWTIRCFSLIHLCIYLFYSHKPLTHLLTSSCICVWAFIWSTYLREMGLLVSKIWVFLTLLDAVKLPKYTFISLQDPSSIWHHHIKKCANLLGKNSIFIVFLITFFWQMDTLKKFSCIFWLFIFSFLWIEFL